jgi:hypothetical protein
MSMIYIKEIYSNDRLVVIQVDGILDSNSISVLASACERHLRENKIIELDLRELLHISREGRDFLKKVQQEGVRVEYPELIGFEEKNLKRAR